MSEISALPSYENIKFLYMTKEPKVKYLEFLSCCLEFLKNFLMTLQKINIGNIISVWHSWSL
jgi:hypothetical protein